MARNDIVKQDGSVDWDYMGNTFDSHSLELSNARQGYTDLFTNLQNKDSQISSMMNSIPLTTVDDTDASLTYNNTWTHSSDINYYNSTKSTSNIINANIQRTFTGTGVNIYDAPSTNRGKIEIFVDNISKGIYDRYSATQLYKQQISITGLTKGIHTLKINITGTRNVLSTDYYFAFDYLEIIDNDSITSLSTRSISNANKLDSIYINVKYPPAPYNPVNGDGTDETSKIIALYNYVASIGKAVLYFPFTTLGYKITSPIDIDISKVIFRGNGSKFDISGVVGGYGFNLYSSVDYTTTYKNSVKAMQGFYITGGTSSNKFAGTGIKLGHATYTNCSFFTVEDISIEGCTNNLELISNAWRIGFKNIYCRWGKTVSGTGLSNMGENINFEHCAFFDASANIEVGTGNFHFHRCSFDNITLRTLGDCNIHINECHFENPGNSSNGYRYVSIESTTSSVFIENSDVVLNSPPAGTFNSCLFYVIDSNVSRGLHLSNLELFQNSNYTPYVNDGHSLLVAGLGRVTFKGGYASWINSMGYCISRSTNRLYNGNAEKGNTTGWSVSGTGTVIADNTTQKEGTYCFKLSAGTGQTVTFKQRVTVQPQQFINAMSWVKRTLNGGSIQTKLTPHAQDGTILTDIGYANSTSDIVDWTISRGITGIVPSGTDYVELQYILTGGSSTSTAYIDDVLLDSI